MIKAFSRMQTADRTMNQLQDNIGKAVDNLNAVPLNSGLLISGVVLAVGTNTIYTGLSQPVTGWFLTRLPGAAVIYDEQISNSNPKTLVLNSDTALTVSLYVF